jgi:hypothetical protein
MRIVPMPQGMLRAGQALPVSLRDGRGGLVATRGSLVPAGADVAALLRRGLWADADELDRWQRKSPAPRVVSTAMACPPDDAGSDYWTGLPARAHQVLRDPGAAGFLDALLQLHDEFIARLDRQTDKSLMALVRLASASTDHYSATHGLLCVAAAVLVARQLPEWTAAEQRSLGLAALSMNVWMTELQDQLATQRDAPTVAQRVVLERHAGGSAKLLRDAGVQDECWLEAVVHHHDSVSGPLAPRSRGQQMARVLQRVDLFTARLSPRRTRAAMSAAAAAQAAYKGEDGQPDEAGMLLIRALGIYPPGCLVRLASQELGVVLRRGAKANLPQVAVISDKAARPLPLVAWRIATEPITAALAPHEFVLDLPFPQLLGLAGS